MAEETITKKTPEVKTEAKAPVAPRTAAPRAATARTAAPRAGATSAAGRERRSPRSTGGGAGRDLTKNRRQPRRRPKREKPEFEQKILDIRRVTRVMGGGRRFSFSVAMLLGDKRGRVGVGIGKAGDTSLAIEKSIKQAKKNMFRITTTESMSIPHEVSAKYTASVVTLMPAPGKGIVAGGAPRDILEIAGVKDVVAKLQSRSKNHLNNAKATVKALQSLKGEAFVALKKEVVKDDEVKKEEVKEVVKKEK
jgi:small subunit ribosomal protein S5